MYYDKIVKYFYGSALIIATAVISVMGFWYHETFYQYGLPVLILTGVIISIMIFFIIYTFTNGAPIGNTMKLIMEKEDVKRFLNKDFFTISMLSKSQAYKYRQKVIIVNRENITIITGIITSVKRKFLFELNDEDAENEGFSNSSELKKYLKHEFGYFNGSLLDIIGIQRRD